MKDSIRLIGILLAILAPLAAWITHVIYCIATAKYLLLIAGGIVVPAGVIHGFSVWFGLGW